MTSKKLDLTSIEGKMGRMEMKNIMAGCGSSGSLNKCCWTFNGSPISCSPCTGGTSCSNGSLFAC